MMITSHEDHAAHRVKLMNNTFGTRLFAARDYKAGELILAPRCNVNNLKVVAAPPEGAHSYVEWTRDDETTFVYTMSAPAKPALEPFFLVRTVNEKDANLHVVRANVSNFTVPTLVNKVDIRMNDELGLAKKAHEVSESLEARSMRIGVAKTLQKATQRVATGQVRAANPPTAAPNVAAPRSTDVELKHVSGITAVFDGVHETAATAAASNAPHTRGRSQASEAPLPRRIAEKSPSTVKVNSDTAESNGPAKRHKR
jgi:hypothetical protein